jgi:cell division protein FtsB
MDRPTIERQISDHRRNLKELRLRRAALECQIDRTVKLLNDAEAALRELAEAGAERRAGVSAVGQPLPPVT